MNRRSFLGSLLAIPVVAKLATAVKAAPTPATPDCFLIVGGGGGGGYAGDGTYQVTGGTYTISFAGRTTKPIAWNATQEDLKRAIQGAIR